MITIRCIAESNIESGLIRYWTWDKYSHVEFVLPEGYLGSRLSGGIQIRPFDWNMTFNMGIGRLLEFRMMLAAVREKNWKEAAKQMLNSLWASQVKGRATELAEQMETGTWFNPEA